MLWVFGLGNPGRRYEGTRHNVGFAVVDELARRAGIAMRRSWRLNSTWGSFCLGQTTLVLVKPATMMNRSGQSAAAWRRRKGLAAESTILVYDDMSLPCGRVRVRAAGGPGGHNGVRSVIAALGSDALPRVRIGVGSPPRDVDAVRFVLSSFTPAEHEVMVAAVNRAADAVEHLVEHGVDSAMNAYNGQCA